MLAESSRSLLTVALAVVATGTAIRLAPARTGVALACPDAIPGAERWVHAGSTVIVGELHGTRQIPEAFAAMACHAAQTAPLVVGLEFPRFEQPALDAYLASDGGPADRSALLDGVIWTSNDGRSSAAMFELIDQVRSWRASGTHVDVVAFDVDDFVDANSRDAGMARHLAAARRARPDATLLVLTGGLHARLAPTPDVTWMAERLSREVPNVVALDAVFGRGTAWVCLDGGNCGVHDVGRGEDPGPTRVTDTPTTERGALVYHGQLHVGAVDASPPAKQP